ENNAMLYKLKVVTAICEAHRIKKLSWFFQSPDLNPIENLWDEMKEAIHKKSPVPSNLKELKNM
ncbi:14931_t:CDS:1, partial [Acaulospora morrowiae]